MKYVGLLVALVIIYFVLARQVPTEPAKEAIVQTEAVALTHGSRDAAPPAGSALKRPFDRTQDALKKVEARNGSGEF